MISNIHPRSQRTPSGSPEPTPGTSRKKTDPEPALGEVQGKKFRKTLSDTSLDCEVLNLIKPLSQLLVSDSANYPAKKPAAGVEALIYLGFGELSKGAIDASYTEWLDHSRAR